MRGPQRRKRKPAPTAPKPVAAAPAPVVARFYCERHDVAFGLGDESHVACPTRVLERSAREERRNTSVYFDDPEGKKRHRLSTGMEGLDRVLGGGFVLDALYLLTGERGAGKSTFLLQVCQAFLVRGYRVLYVSAEENASQVKERAARLGIIPDGRVLHTKDLADLDAELDRLAGTDDDPDLIIVDSAQTIADRSPEAVGKVGSPQQALHVGHHLDAIAKGEQRCIILIGQETKDGQAAGSQQLPHLVDVVLELHRNSLGERYLTDPKNRFGIADEVLVLDMGPKGLVEIGNATEETLERRLGDVGIVPFAAADRQRPVLLAVTASALEIEEDMVAKARVADGYDPDRLDNVLLHLQKHCGCFLRGRAIRVHVPPILGETVKDAEIDLAVAAALLSALHNRPVPKAIVTGRIGIDGHIDGDKRTEMRLLAARDHKRLKFAHAFVPPWVVTPTSGIATVRIRHMNELCAALFGTNLSMPRPVKDDAEAA